jgi:RNA-binding protein 25
VPAAERSTIVYVGKIAPTLNDDVVSSLLNACGTVKSWKRQEDPSTKEKKGFGFCEYEDADGCLCAIRLLNGLKVDAHELLLKANTTTKAYIEEYEANKLRERQQSKEERLQRAKLKQEEGEVLEEEGQEEDEEARDNKVLERIMAIVSEREEQFQKTLPQPPPLPPSMKPGAQVVASKNEMKSSKSSDLDREELLHAREREMRKEEERERREEEERRKELERIYEARVKEWERVEKDTSAMRGKEREREKSMEADRRKIIHQELEEAHDDPELNVPLWLRKPISSSRRSMDRRKRRMQEEQEDDSDRQRELRDGPYPPRRPWYEVLAAEVAERKRRRQEEEARLMEEQRPSVVPSVPEQDDAIMQAMMAAAQR